MTTVVVREGEAKVATPAGVETGAAGTGGVADRRRRTRRPTFAPVAASTASTHGAPRAIACTRRRGRTHYVSRQMIGQADLDAYGAWQIVSPTTAPSGFRPSSRNGRRIASATGRGCPAGATRGSIRRRGATRRSITVAGRTSAAVGAGVPARSSHVRCGRRRSSRGTAAGAVARAGTAPSTVGCRSAGASRSSRGGTGAPTAATRATTGRMRSTSPSVATRRRRTMRTGACRAALPQCPVPR